MTTIQKFEDLRCWKSARELVKMVYEITNEGSFQRDFGLRDQIRRAAISVMSNIAEGFGSGSDSEFVRFLGYSRRSISETQSQLYTALDINYLTQEQFEAIYTKANETERQVNAFIGYLAKSKRNSIRDAETPYVIEHPDDLSDL